MDFELLYNKIELDYKLNFLFNLLKKDQKLKLEFLENIKDEERYNGETLSLSEFENQFESYYERYVNIINEIDIVNFDSDDYDNDGYDRYIDYWEIDQDCAEQIIDEATGFIETETLDCLLQGRVDKMLSQTLAFLFASQEVEINDEADNLFESSSQFFLRKIELLFDQMISKIEMLKISESLVYNALNLAINLINKLDEDRLYLLKHIDLLFNSLLTKISDVSKFKSLYQLIEFEMQPMPMFCLEIIKENGKRDQWEKLAVKSYVDSFDVANQLLDYYYVNNKLKYLELAEILIDINFYTWSDKIKAVVTRDYDLDLYKKLCLKYCYYNYDAAYYRDVFEYLSIDEKNEFYQSIKHNSLLLVQVLAIEEKYDDIKDIIEGDLDSYDLNKMLNIIVEIEPMFCFYIVEKVSQNLLKKERGRNVYRRIVGLIQVVQAFEELRSSIYLLTTKLYNHKPNLPALKDEMRKAGLV
ncbi:MAG: hypothetical protein N4A49_04385 [Marinifilaceae bacterium]|jgi:hypothetical protein|nr:hypothetical protein [Marinifilaceae bacterium]